MRLVRAAAVALAVLLAGPGAPAYLVRRSNTGVEYVWNLSSAAPNVVGGKVTFYVDQASVSASYGVTGSQFAAAVRASVQSWEDVEGAAIAFQEDAARAATAKNSSDKVNRFGFSPGVLSPFQFAAAFTLTQNNKVSDVDVVFNPDPDALPETQQDWSVQTPGNTGKADVQAVSTHEWGHGIGMDHIPLGRATMFFAAAYGAIHLRSLEPDDESAARHAYPDAAALAADFGTIRGRVDVAGTTNDRGAQVTALDFVTGFPAASTLTATDGTYALEGLAPGVYRILASPIGSLRIAQGVYSDFWDSSPTAYFPAVRGQDGAADGSTGIHILSAGETMTGVDLSVSSADPTGEPNDAQGQAHGIDVGDSVGGRLATAEDEDWFSFPGTSGQAVSVYLDALHLGSLSDARLSLRRPNGAEAASSRDIAGQYPDDYVGEDGPDLDARILDFPLDATGTWRIQVELEAHQVSGDTEAPAEDTFYVLTLLPGGGTPSAFTSTLTATPEIVEGDGLSTASLVFEPRSLTGSSSGSGLAVTMDLVADGDADGSFLAPVMDNLDGTYSATLLAPDGAGSDVVRALVGGAPLATVTVRWLGPADFAASDFAADPRRIRPDGASQSTVVLLPRDANGLALGPGRSVELSTGDTDAAIGETEDGGDGTYAAVVTAGTDREDLAVAAFVDGSGLGGTIFLGVGFPLEDVLEDAGDDLAAMLEGVLPAKAVPKVQAAAAAVAIAAGFPLPEEAGSAVKATAKAAKQMEAAAKKGAATAALSRELAEACREAALDALADAIPLADEDPEIAALGKAQAAFDAAEALLDAGLRSKACAKFGAVWKQTVRIE